MVFILGIGEQNLDEAHSSPGLHVAAGPGLAEQCATLVQTLSFTIFLSRVLEIRWLRERGFLLILSFLTGWMPNRDGESNKCL